MQLNKLYCNSKNFKNITFNLNKLNVIYADVKSDLKEKKNSHDLGKTKLAELIDFMLLKKIDKNHFFLKIKENNKSVFNNHIFYIELFLNTGEYLTIKRNIESNTKISFTLQNQTTSNYNAPTNWDYENVSINKAQNILSEYLSFDFFHNKTYNYRKSISYSLRTQDDFKDVYKLNKFVGGKDIDWKPFMFDLLGFKGELLRLKYDNDSKINDINNLINSYKSDYSVKVEERDEIIAEKTITENEFKEIEQHIDRFNFYKQDKSLIKKGIVEIENVISNLNSESYKLNFELEKLKISIKNKFSFDIEKVKKVFEETSIYFSDQLTSDYQELMNFNKKLTVERNKLLKRTIKDKEQELTTLNSRLISLNQDRESLLTHLTDSDTFTKFKKLQKDLVKVEGQLLKYEEKIKAIDKIIQKENDIDSLKTDIKTTINELKKIHQTTDQNQKYKEIRTLFSKFYKHIMDENAVLSWNLNSNDNVNFIPPKVKSKVNKDKDTAKDEGNTYMKLLCVAFDLSMLCTYNKESYYRFVYHDDVLSQQDNGIKIRLLELIANITKKYKIQYILSVIKSDLPQDISNEIQNFSEKEIVLKLDDKDISGTLFGFEF
jgi:uncharacterized protein YydD (DUF2326 family)